MCQLFVLAYDQCDCVCVAIVKCKTKTTLVKNSDVNCMLTMSTHNYFKRVWRMFKLKIWKHKLWWIELDVLVGKTIKKLTTEEFLFVRLYKLRGNSKLTKMHYIIWGLTLRWYISCTLNIWLFGLWYAFSNRNKGLF